MISYRSLAASLCVSALIIMVDTSSSSLLSSSSSSDGEKSVSSSADSMDSAVNADSYNSSGSEDTSAKISVDLTEILPEDAVKVTNDSNSVLVAASSSGVCPRLSFMNVIFTNVCPRDSSAEDSEGSEDDGDSSAVTRKVACSQKMRSNQTLPTVRIFNSSELLAHLGSRTNNSVIGRCTVVLFYAPWCVFCARLAPHYNALARAFPTLDVVAIDAFHFSSLNSRFGTIAVPNIMVFHNAKAVARFNNTERTLANIAAFVTNITGIASNESVVVKLEDNEGPLSSTVSEQTDYLLVLSWIFVLGFISIACCRSATGRRVWNTLVAIGNHREGRHQLHLD